ncbi:MAG: DUF2306 domain-containing protein [Alphaproteobacteria bacterium]|nr:DUF2306 domain-containing protein [Alphaproteobacteria bacterium]
MIQASSQSPLALARRLIWPAIAVALLVGLAPVAPAIVSAAGAGALHAPNFALIADEPAVLQVHILAAATAFLIGLVILFQRKGTAFHRSFGWAWVTAMGATAVSSLFMTGLNGGFYSVIHLLSGWVIVALPIGVWAIRRRNVGLHKRMMTGLFVGGLVVAGAFTFVPGRLMWTVFFG